MQADGELVGQASSTLNQVDADMRPAPPNETQRSRKVTVQLSERMFERLENATDRPGLGKSMVVEAALERFLDPAPPIEGLIHEALAKIGGKIERMESEISIIAETAALHARYHLTITPPMSPSQQREACALGHQRFTALAGQVDRRIRLGRPLMRETIDRLNSGNSASAAPESGHGTSLGAARAEVDQDTPSVTVVDETSEPLAAAEEGGSTLNFRHLPNAFC